MVHIGESDEHVHWSQTRKSGTSCDTRKAHLRDWCVDYSFLAKLVQKPFRDLHRNKSVFGISFYITCIMDQELDL